MSGRLTREDCLLLLWQKAQGLGRFPQKSDFDSETVSMVKAYFGPWPRALEAAQVKVPDPQREGRRREKRRRARANQRRYRQAHRKGRTEE